MADDEDNTVSRIDSNGAVTAVIPVGPGASGIAVGAGAVWVANTLADTLRGSTPRPDRSRPRSVSGTARAALPSEPGQCRWQ